MTVFNGDNNQNTNTNDDTNQTEGNQSYVQQLVASKGEQWGDPEIIAKGKIESDTYIEKLKAELEEAKAAAAKAKTMDDVFASLEQKKAAEPTNANVQGTEGGANDSNTKNSVSEDDLKSLVEKTLTEREYQSTVAQNLAQVNSQLEELYGTEATSTVQKKAQELGLSMDRLGELAAESPNAFFSLIGEKAKQFKPIVQGSVRTEGVNATSPNKRNHAYYKEIRKKDPRQYARLQDQMLKDRMEQGDAFYN